MRLSPRLALLSTVPALFAGLFLRADDAHADVAPPGVKAINYSFSVKGLAAAPDRVLFAYPCGPSNGRPQAEHQKLEEGADVHVGRRGGSCTIYSVDKTAYEAWRKDFKPQPGEAKDPGVEKLVSESVKCTGGPTPITSAPQSDPRSSIHQTITVTTLNKTTCVLSAEPVSNATDQPAALPSPASPPSSWASSSSAASPSAPSASPSSSSSSPKSGGCSFSSTSLVGTGAGSSTGLFALALASLACIAARRRR